MNRIHRFLGSISALLCAAVLPVMAQDEEVNLNKTATYDYETHQGEITLESFVPGSVHYVYEPFDVVMVLDVSSSMEGNPSKDMKAAACSVVNQIYQFNQTSGMTELSKAGVITFSSNASIICSLDVVNVGNLNTILDKVNNIKLGSTTNPSAGLNAAYNMLNDVDSGRKKFVVFFTDGKPGSNFHDTSDLLSAERAVASAYAIKSSNIDIFSIGLFKSDPSNTGLEFSSGYKVSIKDFLEHVSSLYPNVKELTHTGTYTSDNIGDIKCSWVGDNTRIVTDVEYYRWAKQSSDLDGIFTDIITHIVTGASTLEAYTTMKDFVNNNFFQYPENADESNIRVLKQKCLDYNKTTNVFTFGPDMELTAEEKANIGIKLTRADKNVPNSRDLIEVYGYDYAANWCGLDESGPTPVAHGYKLVIKFPYTFKGGTEVSGALKTNTEDSGIYPVQTDDEGNPMTDDQGKPITEDEPTGEYTPPEILFNTLTIIRENLDAGETAIYEVTRDGEFVCNVALGGIKDTPSVSKTIYGLPGDEGLKFKVTETNWNWAYHTAGDELPSQEGTIEVEIKDDEKIPVPLEFTFSGAHRENKEVPSDPVNLHNHGESFVVNKLVVPMSSATPAE